MGQAPFWVVIRSLEIKQCLTLGKVEMPELPWQVAEGGMGAGMLRWEDSVCQRAQWASHPAWPSEKHWCAEQPLSWEARWRLSLQTSNHGDAGCPQAAAAVPEIHLHLCIQAIPQIGCLQPVHACRRAAKVAGSRDTFKTLALGPQAVWLTLP